MDTTIKVSAATRDRIKAIGRQRNQSAEKVILSALDELDRAMFWDAYDTAVAEEGPPAAESAWDTTTVDLND